ncbi:flavin reductase [Sinorhizobium sp. BG8]|uniref:flavin reductase n=1 Tax=Sinorhizobium sp. BG8 TaxID=2613773 RepID=UPI00193D56C2|nr:flavin reductase [Sinorhizobium sp. BG8]QRM53193.1 FMN reductase [Sinorhizobium sp. BG8]
MTQPHTHPSSNDESRAVSRENFREAMSRLAAAVNIVTTDGTGGRAGFTATAVCSVTDSPPTLLVCLNRNSSASAACLENGVLCVNTLHPSHETLSNLFGGKTPMAERFDSADWAETASGSPRLADAIVAFDCKVERMAEVGTHTVLFCEVIDIAAGDRPEALLYFARRYHTI